MPWRDDTSPYAVFVSEIMLQQTQVHRVEKYFTPFCHQFPDFPALAGATLDELLLAWKGLGYNRRVKFMRQSALIIQQEYGGHLPTETADLLRLPGIGPNTAGSIAAFAYNAPVVFIETNIRRVFIHEFFKNSAAVHDRDILPMVKATLPANRARIWYWALMDYGVSLKGEGREAARKSLHHNRQSEFEGSVRQLRAAILHELTALHQNEQSIDLPELAHRLEQKLSNHPFDYDLLGKTLIQLEREGFVAAEKGEAPRYSLEK